MTEQVVKRVKEINSSVSLEEVSKQYEQKMTLLEAEKQKLTEQNVEVAEQMSNAKVLVLKDEVEFFKKVISVVKNFKS